MPLQYRCRYLGNPEQMYYVRSMKFDEGKAKNTSVYQVQTGGKLAYSLLADNGLDIGELFYKGVNMNFLTKNGYVSPYLAETCEDGFTRYFPAGMMYTCGLMSVGNSDRDGGSWQPAHGRYHNIPAEETGGYAENDRLIVRGKIRETQFFGHSLEINRTVESAVGSSEIILTDILTNLTPATTEFMLLYHFNFGYPFLGKELHLILPDGTQTSGRTPYAQANIDKNREFCDPIDGEEEQVFFHKLKDENGLASVRLENSKLKIGAKLSFSADTLPILAHWKCMRSGEYVLGLEPTNSYIMGRSGERKNGTLKTIAPFSSQKMTLKLSFYDLE